MISYRAEIPSAAAIPQFTRPTSSGHRRQACLTRPARGVKANLAGRDRSVGGRLRDAHAECDFQVVAVERIDVDHPAECLFEEMTARRSHSAASAILPVNPERPSARKPRRRLIPGADGLDATGIMPGMSRCVAPISPRKTSSSVIPLGRQMFV